jgi:hypothetical protein
VHSTRALFFKAPAYKTAQWPSASTVQAVMQTVPEISIEPLLGEAPAVSPNIGFEARALVETGEVFKADAKMMKVSFVWAGAVNSAEVERVNSPGTAGADASNYVFHTMAHAATVNPLKMKEGGVYGINTHLGVTNCYRSVATALSIPIKIRSENIERLPKALWMRYMLMLVKESGENAKNLEIIGLYHIPKNGVKTMKHDHSTGSLHIVVDSDALASTQRKILIARRKDNSALVSCAVEIV